ncbi:protein of uncharacterised function DUF222 [Mycolicibacterium aurum]|uniref:Protein of uncharacterized function DUF222 n=2 Tax=Mycolicibacterium aurum TaxID=1791 RepID=A0A3S4TBN2_MYCAU|nr:protein of uncharacterised function DUF222 [Mycolicibacterium aurum]
MKPLQQAAALQRRSVIPNPELIHRRVIGAGERSVATGTIKRMFDALFAGFDESALLTAVEQAAREEAQAAARKLSAIAELVYTTVDEDDERGGWAYDPWKNTSALLGAVLSISQKRASGQMRIAVALRGRLPKIAALLCQGRLSPRLISEITWRTQLVDDAMVALVDAALADRAVTWGPLSDEKLVRSIEAVIDRYDPDAVRLAQEVIRGRDVRIGAQEDPKETATIWGRLMAGDAAALEVLITGMVNGVCAEDPRTVGDRRSDALGALIHGNEVLRCRCGSSGCTASAPAKSRVVISVIADQAAIDSAKDLIAAQDREHQQQKLSEKQSAAAPEGGATPTDGTASEEGAAPEIAATPVEEPGLDGQATEAAAPAEPTSEGTLAESGASSSPCQRDSGLALMPDGKVLPIAALAEAIRGGAAIKALWLPGPDPEPQYRPSAKLAAFVRARDQFCRFPGCDVPALRCDIDHVVPWPYGPTHPSNLNCACRDHHLAKTFWEGWRDVQRPDGAVVWTDPTGRSYTTMPGSRLFFPSWGTTTAELPPLAVPPPDPDRLAKMPRRRRTRAAENAARIKAERDANAARRAREERPAAERQQGPPDYGNDPPPF